MISAASNFIASFIVFSWFCFVLFCFVVDVVVAFFRGASECKSFTV